MNHWAARRPHLVKLLTLLHRRPVAEDRQPIHSPVKGGLDPPIEAVILFPAVECYSGFSISCLQKSDF